MGINVGDATLTFLGDTTQLDLAFEKVNAGSKGAVQPAANDVEQLAQEWRFAGNTASTAGEQAMVAGEEMAAAGKLGAQGMREARGEIALVGEATGVTIPRHLRGFVASLPGVGEALNAAFSATAVLFLISILAEGAKKLTEFIADHYIYTDAIKEEEKAQKELNDKIKGQVDKLKELQLEYKKLGKEGWQASQVDIDELTKSIDENNKKLNDSENNLYSYRNDLGATKEQAQEASRAVGLLTATLAEQNQALINAQLKQQSEELAAFTKTQEAKIGAQKTYGDALAQLVFQQARIEAEKKKVGYLEESQAKQALEDKLYQIERTSIARKIAVERADPEKNKDTLIALNAELEAVDLKYHTKLLANYADFLSRMKVLKQTKVETEASVVQDELALVSAEAEARYSALNEAYDVLNIEGTERLKAQLEKVGEAFEKMKQSGIASTLDLLQAQRQLLILQIEIGESQGENTAGLEKQLAKVNGEIDDMINKSDRLFRRHTDLFKLWEKGAPKAGKVWKDLSGEAKHSLDQMAQAAEAAFASAILSEDSFGHALRKGTAQVLAEIGARSLVYAVFYTAMGFAKLAEQDYAGATAAFTAAAIYGTVGVVAAAAAYAINPKDKQDSAGQTDTSTKTQLGPQQQQPTTATNVIKFASGGVVSGPTLALVGDRKGGGGQREAAIPLDDPEAVSAIVEALGGGRGGDTHIHVRGLVSADNLNKITRKISKQVNGGKVRLTSSQSLRVTSKG